MLYFTKKLFKSVGPEIAFLINSKVKSPIYSFDITKNYQKIEIAGVIGLSYSIFKFLDIGFQYGDSWYPVEKWATQYDCMLFDSKASNRRCDIR